VSLVVGPGMCFVQIHATANLCSILFREVTGAGLVLRLLNWIAIEFCSRASRTLLGQHGGSPSM